MEEVTGDLVPTGKPRRWKPTARLPEPTCENGHPEASFNADGRCLKCVLAKIKSDTSTMITLHPACQHPRMMSLNRQGHLTLLPCSWCQPRPGNAQVFGVEIQNDE